jgi:hypothetical protein
MKIDFSEVRNVLAHVESLLEVHEGEDIPQAQIGVSLRNSGKMSVLLSDLLAAQDFLRLADAELSTICLISEGRADPRRSPARRRTPSGALTVDTNRRVGTAPSHTVGPIRRVPSQPRPVAT